MFSHEMEDNISKSSLDSQLRSVKYTFKDSILSPIEAPKKTPKHLYEAWFWKF